MQERIWTVSNLLSLARVLLVAPAAYCLTTEFAQNRLWAAGIIALAVATDFLDGYLARRLHQVSELGKIIDPLADKIAVAAVTLVLVSVGDVPLWFLIVVLLRDVLIVFGGMYIQRKKKVIVQSNWPGKIAVSAVAMYMLLSTLKMETFETFRAVTLWFSVAMMVLSLAVYSQRLFIGRSVRTSKNDGTA